MQTEVRQPAELPSVEGIFCLPARRLERIGAQSEGRQPAGLPSVAGIFCLSDWRYEFKVFSNCAQRIPIDINLSALKLKLNRYVAVVMQTALEGAKSLPRRGKFPKLFFTLLIFLNFQNHKMVQNY